MLRLSSTDWEEEWYKDEGGRDKSLGFTVELVDSSGAMVKNRRVPLKTTLLYGSGVRRVFVFFEPAPLLRSFNRPRWGSRASSK